MEEDQSRGPAAKPNGKNALVADVSFIFREAGPGDRGHRRLPFGPEMIGAAVGRTDDYCIELPKTFSAEGRNVADPIELLRQWTPSERAEKRHDRIPDS